MLCSICSKTLEPVFVSMPKQYRDALHIVFDGGYGEFVDLYRKHIRVVLCGDCAQNLCSQNLWIKKLLLPETLPSADTHTFDKNDKVSMSEMWEYSKDFLFSNVSQCSICDDTIVCVEHKSFAPCRDCMYSKPAKIPYVSSKEYLEEFGFH